MRAVTLSPTRIRERLERLRRSPLAATLARAAAPERVWLVGGALRDAALERSTKDVDAVVERDAARVASALARELGGTVVPLGGERFGALRVVAPAGEVDLWDLRGSPLAPDLERRDFTVNAMALELATGELVDPHGGLEDLARKRLRATRESVFREDPLRVLRLARFAATLGFEADSASRSAARAVAVELGGVAGERVRAELAALWGKAAGFALAQETLEACGAWPELWRPAGGRVATGSARSASLELDRLLRGAPEPEPAERVAAGHALCAGAAAGTGAAGVLERLFERGALSRAEHREALALLALAAERPPRDEPDLAWFVHRAGGAWPLALGLGAAASGEAPEILTVWRDAGPAAVGLLARRGDEVVAPAPLLDGDRLAARLGLAPGPELGRLVRRLREAQVRGEVRSAADAEKWLAEVGRD